MKKNQFHFLTGVVVCLLGIAALEVRACDDDREALLLPCTTGTPAQSKLKAASFFLGKGEEALFLYYVEHQWSLNLRNIRDEMARHVDCLEGFIPMARSRFGIPRELLPALYQDYRRNYCVATMAPPQPRDDDQTSLDSQRSSGGVSSESRRSSSATGTPVTTGVGVRREGAATAAESSSASAAGTTETGLRHRTAVLTSGLEK